MNDRTMQDLNPLVQYAIDNMWGNPELDQQFQVKLERINADLGDANTFQYNGRWRVLPRPDKIYRVYTVGGLHPGYWNWFSQFHRKDPLDRWVNVSELAKYRGMQLDFYNTQGYHYVRSKTWIMPCYDGTVLVAIERVKPIKFLHTDVVYFRCYSPNTNIDRGEMALQEKSNPYVYETMTYENSTEMSTFQARYNTLKARPGFTGIFYNGVFYNKAPNTLRPAVGDELEIWHDPTVKEVVYYDYSSLSDFYSDLDKKRKVILHPPKTANTRVNYMDDNDYYLVGSGDKGLYFHRNDVTAVRQLTHRDVSLSDDQIRQQSNWLKELNDVKSLKIMVLVRDNKWSFNLVNEKNRIKYLYRLDDQGIMMAFTGQRATIPEWTAAGLEKSDTLSLMRSQIKNIDRDKVANALGYNAMTRVLSDTTFRVKYKPGQRGVKIPTSFWKSCTVFEHDANGSLLTYWHSVNSPYFSPRHPDCEIVELVVGKYGREIPYVVTTADQKIDPLYDYHVYKSKYSINDKKLVGDWIEATGTDLYTITNGYLVWKKLDKVNERGIVVKGDRFLLHEFSLDHLDHSLSFSLDDIYLEPDKALPTTFANIDIWLNNKPLINVVDFIYENRKFYIHNRQHLVDGAQNIVVRCSGISKSMTEPVQELELGFVQGSVLGVNDRYNIRSDRATRLVVGGRLMVPDEFPRSETTAPSDVFNVLNGLPYMVKHNYQPILRVKDGFTYVGYEEARDLDKRISDYLTLWCKKPEGKVLDTMMDKYMLYSPFLNVIVNGIKNKFITVPAFETEQTQFSNQQLEDTVSLYKWWMKYDPIINDMDRRYFDIMPFANIGLVTVTSHEFIFIKQINDYYLKSACSIEGNFRINNNV